MKVYAYIRVSSKKTQDYNNQKYGILKYADSKKLVIDEWVKETVSGTKKVKERELGRLVEQVEKDNLILISEISRIGRTLYDIMGTLNILMDKGVRVHAIKEGYELGDDISSKVLAFAFSLSAEIERNLISSRTSEALAKRKSEGKTLGRPFGYRLERVKLSEHEDKIRELLTFGVSLRSIGRMFNCHHSTVGYFIRSRGIEE
jgi:DNA invertase Pin-like site-specific DNA recombinase